MKFKEEVTAFHGSNQMDLMDSPRIMLQAQHRIERLLDGAPEVLRQQREQRYTPTTITTTLMDA